MKVQSKNAAEYTITLKKSKLDTLICAAKWVLKGRSCRVPSRAKDRLKEIVEAYQKGNISD